MTTLRSCVRILPLFTLILGCGETGDRPKTVDVSGTVTLDGDPVEGAEVNFFSARANFLASGMTDKDGKYSLYQGAAVGENKVWISKDTSKTELTPLGMDPAENPEADVVQIEAAAGTEMEAEVKGEQFPAKFSNPDQTVLKYSVPEGGAEDANFKLTKE